MNQSQQLIKRGMSSIGILQRKKLIRLRKNSFLEKNREHFRDDSIVLHRILNEGRPVRGQYHRPDKDTHVLINASPILIENKIIGGVATEQNITNIIRLNEELDSNSSVLVQKSNPFSTMVSGSPKFQEALKIAQKVAHADIPIHLTGNLGRERKCWHKRYIMGL